MTVISDSWTSGRPWSYIVYHTMLSSTRFTVRLLRPWSISLLDTGCRGINPAPILAASSDSILGRDGRHRQHLQLPPSSRSFLTQPSSRSSMQKKHEEEYRQEYAQRHSGILLHPDSIGKTILPGNFVLLDTRSGTTKKRITELAHGYFWNIKELKKIGEKPILSNEHLIPEKQANVFPQLHKLVALSGEKVNLPDYFLRGKNKSKDDAASARCTLVTISFRDFGHRLLQSWLGPFQTKMGSNDKVEVVRLNLSEGWFNKWVLRGVLRLLVKRNTPVEEHASTFLYFGSDLESFRDALRMHNVLTGYVFLLDGLGRVRFAGSGSASEEEGERLAEFAKDLVKPVASPSRLQSSRKRFQNRKRVW